METLLGDNVSLHAGRDTLVVSCDDELTLQKAIAFLEVDGAELIEPATWAGGGRYVATLLKAESRLLR